MFRLTTTIRRTLPAIVLTTVVAATAGAQDRTTDRYYDESLGTWVMTRSVEGENGGTAVTERTCGSGENEAVSGCVKEKTVTTAAGETFTRERLTIRGPERTRAFGRFTDADGDVTTGHRRWRN